MMKENCLFLKSSDPVLRQGPEQGKHPQPISRVRYRFWGTLDRMTTARGFYYNLLYIRKLKGRIADIFPDIALLSA